MRTGAFTVTFTAGVSVHRCARAASASSSPSSSPSPQFPSCANTQTLVHIMKHTCTRSTSHGRSGASAQYVQVYGRGFGQALERAVDLLDVQPHVGLPLPAAQHQVVDLLRTGAGPLQHSALSDALDHLEENIGWFVKKKLIYLLSHNNVVWYKKISAAGKRAGTKLHIQYIKGQPQRLDSTDCIQRFKP